MAQIEVFLGVMPLLLLLGGIYFAVRLRAFPFLHPVRVGRALLGTGEGREARLASLRATGAALSGTIGVGNMVGVAVALSIGGAGAIFWMWVSALAAMLLKYAEITLALDSRSAEGQGGTPHSFTAAGHPFFGRLFALLCLLNALVLGGAVQAGAVRDGLQEAFGLPPVLTAVLLLAATLPALLGGTRRLLRMTAALVPPMCLLYLAAACLLICRNAAALPQVLCRIFSEAFSPLSAGGGVLGFLSCRALREGAARGLMSNEGGSGTSPLAHATATPREPAVQGLFGILEVGVDTLLICTVTALSLLTALDPLPTGLSGMGLLYAAFSSSLGTVGVVFLALSLSLFAYATILCEAFYGEACANFLLKGHPVCREFRIFFCLSLPIGILLPQDTVWLVSDLLLAAMTWLNLPLLFSRADRIVALTRRAGLLPCAKKRKSRHAG